MNTKKIKKIPFCLLMSLIICEVSSCKQAHISLLSALETITTNDKDAKDYFFYHEDSDIVIFDSNPLNAVNFYNEQAYTDLLFFMELIGFSYDDFVIVPKNFSNYSNDIGKIEKYYTCSWQYDSFNSVIVTFSN